MSYSVTFYFKHGVPSLTLQNVDREGVDTFAREPLGVEGFIRVLGINPVINIDRAMVIYVMAVKNSKD